MRRSLGWILFACGAAFAPSACSSGNSPSTPLGESEAPEKVVSALGAAPLPSVAVNDVRRHATLPRHRPSRVQAPLRAPMADAVDPFAPLTPAPSPKLTYRNGPMLQDVDIHAVYWGTTVALPSGVDLPTYFSTIAGNGPFFQMLAEYDVTKPAPFTIGAGTFSETFVDKDAPPGPVSPQNRPTVTDAMVQAELARAIDQGFVKKTDNSLYMVFFPPGTDVDGGGGSLSCQSFCGYHNSFVRNAGDVYYAIIPDFTVDCASGCGADAASGLYETVSHELVEAVTDANVGVNDLAWYDDANGEIGDICDPYSGTVSGEHVQLMWSNEASGCRDQKSTELDTISVTPAGGTAAAGASATFNLALSGNAGVASLAITGLPGNVTAPDGGAPAFAPASISPGSSANATLEVAAGTLSADYPFTASATDTVGVVHYAQPMLHVVGAAPKITSFSPATGPSSGGTTVKVLGTGFGPNAIATVGGLSAQVVTTTPAGTELDLLTPGHAAGNATIVITNANDAAHAASSATPFKYVAGSAPTVTQVIPNAGPTGGNNGVVVIGSNFNFDTTVTIGGIKMDPNANQAGTGDANTYYIGAMPAHAAGAVDVVVTNGDAQSATLKGGYTYGGDPTPGVTSLSVNEGPTAGGTYVALFGYGFAGTPTVKFGGTAAKVTTVNGSFLGVTTPAHAAGAVTVQVTSPGGQTATSPVDFTYVAASDGGTDGGETDGGVDGSVPPSDAGLDSSADAGLDSGSGSDSGSGNDSGSGSDSGSSHDAGSPSNDSGSPSNDSGSPGADSGPVGGNDSGATTTPADSGADAAGGGGSGGGGGCGCAVPGESRGSSSLSLLAFGAVAVIVGRRRARRRS